MVKTDIVTYYQDGKNYCICLLNGVEVFHIFYSKYDPRDMFDFDYIFKKDGQTYTSQKLHYEE